MKKTLSILALLCCTSLISCSKEKKTEELPTSITLDKEG